MAGQRFVSLAAALMIGSGGALAAEKPTELKIGITAILSGPASVLGVNAFLTAFLQSLLRSMRPWESEPGSVFSRGCADSQGRMGPMTNMTGAG